MRNVEINPEQLNRLKEALSAASVFIKEAAAQIVADEVSNFPVFIAHTEEIQLGEPLAIDLGGISEWKLRATTAEDLLKIGVIEPEKAKIFVAGYKDYTTHACILAIFSPQNQSFIYFPYP